MSLPIETDRVGSAPSTSSRGYSFCLITHGKRPEKLRLAIESIRALAIPNCEILVGGEITFELAPGVTYVPAVEAARNGRLGEMRNRLTERARYDHLVVADDDMLFHADFYLGLQAFGEDYQVMCVRLLNPDGTRFWDWATDGGPRGHTLLDYSATDPFVYVTGGLCIMKAEVARKVKWSDKLGFYEGEDNDFSSRLRAAGIPIVFNRYATVTHNDARYTQTGQSILKQEREACGLSSPDTLHNTQHPEAWPIHVLFEASVFGAAVQQETFRTGIFRATRELAAHLLASGQCEMKFWGVEEDTLLLTEQYLKSQPEFWQAPFSTAAGIRFLAEQRSRIQERARIRGGKTIKDRISLELLRQLRWGIQASKRVVAARDLQWANVVHVPAYVNYPNISKRGQLAVFQTIHDLIPLKFPHLFNDDWGRQFLQKQLSPVPPNKWFLVNSNSTKNDLCNLSPGVDPERVSVTYLAASEQFQPCADTERIGQVLGKYGVPPEPYLLSVCTLEPRKNVPHVIKCWGRLVREQKISDLNLVLVGTKGWQFEQIFEEAAGLKELSHRVIFTGYVPDEELAALYSGAMAFVYMSLYEGFGLPALEAMQCGAPVIASNTSSLPEVVGEAGMLLDPGDEEALCATLQQVCENSALRQVLGTRSLQQARKFSWRRCAQETLGAYFRALKSGV